MSAHEDGEPKAQGEKRSETGWNIDPELLESARDLVKRRGLVSPLVPAPWLGRNVWVKLELEQPTRSFKVRGALVRLSSLNADERRAGVIAASAGNHGLGLAWAGKELGVPVRIFVPAVAPDVKVEGMRALGAKVEVCEARGFDAVKGVALEAAAEADIPMISAFDDPFIAAGNGGTLALEIFEAMPAAGRIIVPVGGGGLLSGFVAARDYCGAHQTTIVGVESDSSAAMARSFADDKAVESLAAPGATLAEGLEGGVCTSTHAIAKRGAVHSVVVSEEEIAQGIVFASKHLGTPVEGSAAVAIAWMRRLDSQQNDSAAPTVVVVTGGNIRQQRVQALAAGWRPESP